MARATPWYRQLEWIERASRYVKAHAANFVEEGAHPQVKAYSNAAVATLIFESNNLEEAGLDEAATRRLIGTAGVELPIGSAILL
jgi:hypothetical protein